MTFEEAKKILKKEGYELEKVGRPCSPSIAFTAYESPEICEAMQVVCSAGYSISMVCSRFNDRKARLSLELAENSAPMPGPGEEQPNEGNPALKESASQFNDALLDEQAKRIEKQNHELTRLTSLVEKKENSISRLYYEKSVLEKENENLKKGEIPARYFDKALVDEQEEKIKKLEHEKLDILEMASSCKQTIAALTKEKTNLEDQITILNACKEYNEDFGRKQIKRLGKEIAKLSSIIHDKNEELKRKTKGCCELVTENVDLKKNLSDKDAVLSDVAEELRLSKIREKNLTEVCQKYVKENEKLKKKLADKVVDKIDAQALKSAESALAYKEKVIADLTKKLNVKHKKYVYYNGTIVPVQRLVNTLAGYAAKRYYKELCDQMVDIAEEGGDQSATIVQCDNGLTLSKEEAEIIERCTKNGTELHYSEKDGFTYTNVFDEEIPIRCLRGMFHVFADEEIENMKK